MKSWLDFEQRFRDMANRFSDIRIDYELRKSDGFFRIAGGPFQYAEEFKNLSSLAGKALKKTIRKRNNETEFIFLEKDPGICWYQALKKWSKGLARETYAEERGETDEIIVLGSIDNPALRSANLCLKLQGEHPIPDKSLLGKVWDEYGSKILIGILTALAIILIKLLFG